MKGCEGHGESVLFSSRFLITFLCFLGILFMVTSRLNMSVAIVCMVNHTATLSRDITNSHDPHNRTAYGYTETQTDIETETYNGVVSEKNETSVYHSSNCGGQKTDSEEDSRSDGPFVWSKHQQGIILGSYFWGYLLFQIPSGWIVHRFGSIHVLGLSTFVSCLFCLLTPLLAHQSYIAVIVLRVSTGFVAGMVGPSVVNLLSNWLPPTERARMGSFAYAVPAFCDEAMDWELSYWALGLLGGMEWLFSGTLIRFPLHIHWFSIDLIRH